MFYHATFAPYVMLLFLRRLSQTGGQAEPHRMLSMARLALDDDDTTPEVVREQLLEMTTVFRLLANPIVQLAKSATVESLRTQAQPLLGNSDLLDKARVYHNAAADRHPQLLPECTQLRMALAAYRDALNTAAARLLAHAGKTRALGLLPTERWRTFARDSSTEVLAQALDDLLFDAPEPFFTADDLLDVVEEGLQSVSRDRVLTRSLRPRRSTMTRRRRSWLSGRRSCLPGGMWSRWCSFLPMRVTGQPVASAIGSDRDSSASRAAVHSDMG